MPPQHIDAKSIIGDIEQHNEYFDNLVDIIPANVYVVDTSNNQSTYHQSKHQKKQGKDSKEAKNAEAKRAKAKIGKLKKFDPAQQESTRAKKMRVENVKDDDSDNDSMEGIQFQDNHEEEQEDHKSPKGSNGSKPNKSKSSAHQSRIEDLRSKLRAKLEERKSNSVTNSTSNTMVSKRAARRAEKKKKIEMTKKRQAQSKVSGGSTVTGKFGVASIKIVQDLGGSKINAESKPKDVVDDLAGIDFGGIAGLKDDLLTKGKYSAVNKSLKNMGKKKSLERLLEEAEAKKERLRQLKASDDIEDKDKAKKIEWGDALKAASGEKTRKSDPALLKKAMKRKAKKKARSQEAWKSRMDNTQSKVDEKMSIRNHNIKQRAVGGVAGANLSRKRIKDDDEKNGEGGAGAGGSDKKRPRLGPYAGKGGRAGFEGKKQDFINKGSGKKDVKSQ